MIEREAVNEAIFQLEKARSAKQQKVKLGRAHAEDLAFLGGEAAATGFLRLTALRRLLRLRPFLTKPSGSGGSWPSTNKMRSHVPFQAGEGVEIPASTAAP